MKRAVRIDGVLVRQWKALDQDFEGLTWLLMRGSGPRLALQENKALWGQVMGGAFMQMLKLQPQAWIRQQWKFLVEENDREIGSW